VSGSGISWAVCKSAPRSGQITTPALHHSVFTGCMPFPPPTQQRQSTYLLTVLKKAAVKVPGCPRHARYDVSSSWTQRGVCLCASSRPAAVILPHPRRLCVYTISASSLCVCLSPCVFLSASATRLDSIKSSVHVACRGPVQNCSKPRALTPGR